MGKRKSIKSLHLIISYFFTKTKTIIFFLTTLMKLVNIESNFILFYIFWNNISIQKRYIWRKINYFSFHFLVKYLKEKKFDWNKSMQVIICSLLCCHQNIINRCFHNQHLCQQWNNNKAKFWLWIFSISFDSILN